MDGKKNLANEHSEDMLIVVDQRDQVLGYEAKAKCHEGTGIMHRAFSIFIFNSKDELLLQKRSTEKLLWPGFWSNSVCSHPRKGETVIEAANRRIVEEIGISTQLNYLFTFQYQAQFGSIGSENELCSVFIGFSDDPIVPNTEEIAECRFISIDILKRDLQYKAEVYTPWFKIEWQRIRAEHMDRIRLHK